MKKIIGISLFIIFFAQSVYATTQQTDSIRVDGGSFELRGYPLESYLKGMDKRPVFNVFSSSNWDGYTAGWELKNEELWLVRFFALDKYNNEIGISSIFPDLQSLPVKATWYTGKISVILSRGSGSSFVLPKFQQTIGEPKERLELLDLEIVKGDVVNKQKRTEEKRLYADF